jgi:hypothetical protein
VLSLELEHSKPQPSARPLKLRLDVLFKDLSLLASLWMAQLIVRGTLRRRRKERASRLKRIKLVQEEARETSKQSPAGKLGERNVRPDLYSCDGYFLSPRARLRARVREVKVRIIR